MKSQAICLMAVSLFLFATLAVAKPSVLKDPSRDDLSSENQFDRFKRETNKDDNNRTSFSRLINNIESGLLASAVNAGGLINDSNDVSAPIHKRSSISESSNDTKTVHTISQSVGIVQGNETVPTHLSIDRVSVFKAPIESFGFFPTFLDKSHFGDEESTTDTSTSADTTQTTTEEKETVPIAETTPKYNKTAAEEQLKTEIAEVEAEPVIFTSRV